MSKKNRWNTVTPFSKITALVLFVMLPVVAFYLGVLYQERIDSPLIEDKYVAHKSQVKTFCTMEAKLCPDGSYVSRTGSNCEFEKCLGEK